VLLLARDFESANGDLIIGAQEILTAVRTGLQVNFFELGSYQALAVLALNAEQQTYEREREENHH
jgi:hypothetical protein